MMATTHRLSRLAVRGPMNPLLLSRQAPRQLRAAQLPIRHASNATTESLPISRLRILAFTTAFTLTGYVAYIYATDTRAAFHRWIVPPLLRLVYPDAEDAHDVSVSSMKTLYSLNMHPRERAGASKSNPGEPSLSLTVFGHPLANPIGISAGLDKHADIPDPLFELGAGIVEVGGCTPLPQGGNPKPRMFRIPSLDGLINRYGLNSRGADEMARSLSRRVRRFARSVGLTEEEVLNGKAAVPPGSLRNGRLLAVQIAKNKDTPEGDVAAVSRDYVYCVSRLAPYADVLVVNVSSPNTPGLRDLQAAEPLTHILSAVVDEARKTNRKNKPKVMVKVSPDEDTDAQIEGIAQAVWQSGVDGVIVGNTTKKRNGIVPPGLALSVKEAATLTETGGYSGPMMFERTLNLVGRYREILDGRSLSGAAVATTGEIEKAVEDEAVHASLGGIEGTATGMVADDLVTPGENQKAGWQPEQKIIFATGGITNGEQALKILNAGASVAMVYTGLVYGGAGTITRMKGEMKTSMTKA